VIQSNQNAPFTVLIVGGGIGGLTLAHFVRKAGWRAQVIEKRPLAEMLSGPGGIFIQLNGLSALRQLDEGRLAEALYAQGGSVLAGGFHREDGSPLYLNDPEFVGRQDLGVCISRADLQQLLYRDLGPEVVFPGSGLAHFEQDEGGVRVQLEDGTVLSGDMLVGADGLWSRVRTILEERARPAAPEYSGYCCWRGLFSVPDRQILPENSSWAEYWGFGLRFGWFHVGGDRYSFYAFKNTEQGGADEGSSLAGLRTLFGDYAAPVPAILDALEGETIYRDDICDRPPIKGPWGKGRATLIGDAAHPVQPNIGQGACQAIEDGFELVQALRAGMTAGQTVAEALRAIEEQRSKRVTRVFKVSRQVGELAQSDTRWGVFARNQLYRLMPNWLGDLQFRWLFDYEAEWRSDKLLPKA
tara:strand:- start:1743 stop:2981 length:1239 start_codon:yes stop_codon:yes gene_type:complete